MECCIDYCDKRDETTLTCVVDGEPHKLGFCREHAAQLEARMSAQTNQILNLRAANFNSTTEVLQEALEWVDAHAAMEYEQGH